jgi:hypothetical protein
MEDAMMARCANAALAAMLGLMLVAVSGPMLAAPAAAQSPAAPPDLPGTDAGRFSFSPVEGGVMRLDSRTGAVSRCAQRPSGWACEAVPDDRAALEAEIARLTADNQRLSGRVAELEKRIENSRAGPPPVPPTDVPNPAHPPQATPDLPSDAEVDRVMTFVEKVFRRFMEMVQTLRPDQPPPPKPQPNAL